MTEEAQMCLDEAKESMKNAIDHLQQQLKVLRTGKANPNMLSGITVDYYGARTPLEQMANITTPDARQIVVQPFDKSVLKNVLKEIQAANLGFNPQDDGEIIRIIVPELTEERRKDLVKRAKQEGEDAKVSIRGSRKEAKNTAKQLKNEGLSEDEEKQLEDEIQKLTDKYTAKVDEIVEQKEKDIMEF
ncbi:MAG: ribosome recycling factor [Bacteroidales bacterium]|nr:ribosome recycling factor [Bacteroidales bacterium]MCF8333938.1 ribosome recycling factor [Bacteroidales bacterium]